MLNILYLTYDGLSDPLGKSQILPYLEGLADMGHEITVISFEKEKGSGFSVSGSGLKSIRLNYHKSPPVLSTIYDLYLLRREVKKVLKTQPADIIHCRSYITSLVGLWAKRKYGVKFIFDMRGFWADERVEGGLWNLNNPVYKTVYHYFKKKEKEFLLESDVTISLTQNAKEEIFSWKFTSSTVQRFSSSAVQQINRSTNHQIIIQVIPTCADLNHFSMGNISNIEIDKLRKQLDIREDDKVILYLGSLGTWYMLKEMLDFYDVLRTDLNYKFLFVTKDSEVLNSALESRNYRKGEIIITSCEREEVPDHIALCDFSIFFIIPTYSKKASAATKMGEIMAMGKPVITNTGWGDVEEIVDQSNGILVSGFNQKSYEESIRELSIVEKSSPELIRQTAEKCFSLSKGVEAYDNIYRDLMD